MSLLPDQLDRLYQLPEGHGADTVRALVLELARPADWLLLSNLWRGVQLDLDLPAPAIAVNGVDGYQLWFALDEPVPLAQAQAFLDALRQRYLADVPAARIGLTPVEADATTGACLPAIPALQPQTGQWSAFVAPDLAPIFTEEPWLDMAPNPEAQANVLAALDCITPAAWQEALQRLAPAAVPVSSAAAGVPAAPAPPAPAQAQPATTHLNATQDPRQFLLDVMNHPGIDLHLRIEAAKALLG